MMNVYCFKIFYSMEDLGDSQYRYVIAKDSFEAWEKIEAYRKQMAADGFSDFYIAGEPELELQNAIM